MPFQWISQEKLIWDWDLNPREKDESHVRVIASHMNENGYDPKRPIIVYEFEGADKVDEFYRAATGHHRLEATLIRDVEFPNLPLAEVFVEIIKGTHAEYVRRMLIDNFQHLPGFNKGIGKMPDRLEIKAMRSRLLFFPDVFLQGDRLLAKNWGCDRDTVSKLREGFISEVNNPNDFVDESSFHAKGDFEKIQKIIEDDLYTGIDGKKYPRTTKPAKRFGAPDPMEKYIRLQETLDRVIGSSLFGAINDNSVGKHNIARMLKRAGCYAKGFKQAFLWDNRTDLSAEHVSHLEKANGILQEIIIDVDIFTLNHEQNREKCKIYLNELYTKLTENKESDTDEVEAQPEPVEEAPTEESDESKPVEETLVPKASETKVLKIQGMTIYIDNPDSSKSFPTGVHFSEKKSEDFKDHLISDIPPDVLAELERVANEKLQ